MRPTTSLAALGVLVVLLPAPLRAQDGATLFSDNCAPCHTIGEAGGVGPDLRDVSKRRDRAWLLAFVLDPASIDKAATMPASQDLSREAITAILNYIDSRSAAPAAPVPSETPLVFTAGDVARGEALFQGRERLGNGGPSCLSCHDVGLGRFGGGKLGPDLTRLAVRLKGPKGTAAWLSSPPTGVMRSLFDKSPLTASEVHALTAFFVDRSRPDAAVMPPEQRRFVVLGVAGTAALLILIGALWRGRLRPVRRALIDLAADARPARATHTQGFRSGGRR
jgi:mono/diheme cytochrome c family protein